MQSAGTRHSHMGEIAYTALQLGAHDTSNGKANLCFDFDQTGNNKDFLTSWRDPKISCAYIWAKMNRFEHIDVANQPMQAHASELSH